MVNAKKRKRQVFMCTDCGNESYKWMGFCPALGCGSQIPLVDMAVTQAAPNSRPGWLANKTTEVIELSDISSGDQDRETLPSPE